MEIIKNPAAERIVRLDMDIRSRERALKTGAPGMSERFARKALDRLRTQRMTWVDFLYEAYGFERAAEMIHEVRMDLDAEYRRTH